jgi:hypothetical protein
MRKNRLYTAECKAKHILIILHIKLLKAANNIFGIYYHQQQKNILYQYHPKLQQVILLELRLIFG